MEVVTFYAEDSRRVVIVEENGEYTVRGYAVGSNKCSSGGYCDELKIVCESSKYIVAKRSFIGAKEIVVLGYESNVQSIYEVSIKYQDGYDRYDEYETYYVDQSGRILKEFAKENAIVGLVNEANASNDKIKTLQDENDKLVHALGYYELLGDRR